MTLLDRILKRVGLQKAPKPTITQPREAEIRATIAAGNEARGNGQWEVAIGHYAQALTFDPGNVAIRVQFGHGLKELGRLREAEAAYRDAAAGEPNNADIYVQLGHVLKLQGQADEAIEAYAEAVRRDPTFEPARSELIAAGGRNRLPDALFGRSATTDALTRLSAALRSERGALRDLVSVSTYPVEAYDAFRHTYPVQPPQPFAAGSDPLLVIVDAGEASPTQLRLTLTSLIDQSCTNWIAVIRDRGRCGDHPVASLAAQDDRITFVADFAQPLLEVQSRTTPILLCEAGAVFDPEALGWLLMAWLRTGAGLAYADHDHHTHHWKRGRTYADPALQSMADVWEMTHTPAPPAAVLVAPSQRDLVDRAIAAASGTELRRQIIVEALADNARAVHIPLALVSVRVESLDGPGRTSPPNAPPRPRVTDTGRLIRVIVPTRDEPKILKSCVDSLLSQAKQRDLVQIQVINNRSVEPETADLFRSFESIEQVQVGVFDEPFNWARINNLAAAVGPQDSILVFANNDVEMLTQDWDQRLREALAAPGMGIVGARLLYPDRTVQHAGVVLGVNDNRPVHEGLGRAEHELGPNSRWIRPRQAAAVTGAFMAMDHAIFDQLGSFDERLAVGYNDIDLCLKARAAGMSVLYDPALELIHYESRTRGRADTLKVLWDDEELSELYSRWGGWMMFDPGKNPRWFSTHERPFDGLRNPGRNEILRYLELSARKSPWSIAREIDPLTTD